MIYARKCFPNVAIKGQLRSAPKFPRKTALTAKETEEYNLYVTETTTAIKEKNQRGEIIVNQYQKGISVMDYLQELGINMLTIGKAIEDENLEKSYRLIQSNPKITKEELLTEMGIEEETD